MNITTNNVARDLRVNDMLLVPKLFSYWDGYVSETYFSGIVVRFADDYSRVIVGSYTA